MLKKWNKFLVLSFLIIIIGTTFVCLLYNMTSVQYTVWNTIRGAERLLVAIRARVTTEKVYSPMKYHTKLDKHLMYWEPDEFINVTNATSYGKHNAGEVCTCPCRCNTADRVAEDIRSTCSDHATLRGPEQKVVAFAFSNVWQNPNRTTIEMHYILEAIEENANAVEILYPGWLMRVYHNMPSLETYMNSRLCELQCMYFHLDVCDVSNNPVYRNISGEPRMWHILPMADPLVNIYLSRRLESRPSVREMVAVEEWMKSDLTFHVMRDNFLQMTPIEGGMWGALVEKRRKLMIQLTNKVLSQQNFTGLVYTREQHVLSNLLWPDMKGRVLQHDSFHCDHFKSHGHMRPWPTRRVLRGKYNFVGARKILDDSPVFFCPWSCRPAAHRDWITC